MQVRSVAAAAVCSDGGGRKGEVGAFQVELVNFTQCESKSKKCRREEYR